MNSVVSKKYTKALIAVLGEKNSKDIAEALKILGELSACFGNAKFSAIINAPTLQKSQREAFLLSVVESKNKKLLNFLKLLNQKNRLNLIPEIHDELQKLLGTNKNEYELVVYSSFKLDKKDLANIKERLSQKLGISLFVTEKQMDTEGVRLFVDGMSVETAFLKDSFSSNLKAHILRAF